MISLNFDEDSFNERAKEFKKISDELNDTWEINEKMGKIYLTKKQKISIQNKKEQDSEFEEINNEDISAVNSTPETIYSIEYHVVFHPSYQVPVLYFNAHSDDGRFVSLDDVSKIFVEDYELKQYKDEIYQVISQADHPVLFKPFYMIHPCHIHEVLSKFPESKNFILTFLTIYGPSIRLKIQEGYEKFYLDKKGDA
ncbi:ubiquitin-like-conjugating enzyme ATG10 [Chironomus tepperi]|uniref:ubiquitin-like-conjugating enzyme ATG10 n=1 Tax=Chironomus tepperi TaxID=113505 RepID=UPI00391FB1AC